MIRSWPMTCAVPRTARPCTSAAGRCPPQGVSGRCRRAVDRQLVWHLPDRPANRIAELALAKRKCPLLALSGHAHDSGKADIAETAECGLQPKSEVAHAILPSGTMRLSGSGHSELWLPDFLPAKYTPAPRTS